MKKIIIYLCLFIFSFGFFNNFSNAEVKLDSQTQNILNNLFGPDFLKDGGGNTETKTPKELAKEELLTYPKGQKYVDMVDSFINNRKDDIDYLNRISQKVKNFNFSEYNTSNIEKFNTLKAVIRYIDTSLDELLNV